jgi:hypothetical protein
LEYTSAAVVLAGIVGEYVSPFSSALPKVGLLGALRTVWAGFAITVGIGGEILFSMLVSSVEGKIESLANQRTSEALEKAAEANLLAEKESLARAVIDRDLERLRANDAGLRQHLSSYIFPRKPNAEFLSSLASLPKYAANIQFNDMDIESRIFAEAIQRSLRSIGWEVSMQLKGVPRERFNGTDLPLGGVQLRVRPREGFKNVFVPLPIGFKIGKMVQSPGGVLTDSEMCLVSFTGACGIIADESVPMDVINIIVCPRLPWE